MRWSIEFSAGMPDQTKQFCRTPICLKKMSRTYFVTMEKKYHRPFKEKVEAGQKKLQKVAFNQLKVKKIINNHELIEKKKNDWNKGSWNYDVELLPSNLNEIEVKMEDEITLLTDWVATHWLRKKVLL